MREQYKKNLDYLIWHGLFSGFWFFMPVLYIYFKNKGFTYTEIGLIVSFKFASKLLLEVPAGTIADHLGRKTSLVISSIGFSIAFWLFGMGESYDAYLIAAIFNGTGQAFLSGADTSLIYESLKQIDKESEFSRIMGKRNFYNFMGISLGSVLSGLVAYQGLEMTFVASSIFSILSLVTLVPVVEPEIDYVNSGESKGVITHAAHSARYLISSEEIRKLLLFIVFFDVVINVFFQYQQYLFKDFGIKETYFGYIYGAFVTLTMFGARVSHRVKAMFSKSAVFTFGTLIVLVAIFLSGFSTTLVWVFIGIGLMQVSLGFSKTLFVDYFQDEVQSFHRSTAWSIKKMISTSVIALVSPLIGYMADHFDHKTAIISLCALMGSMWALVLVSKLLRYRRDKILKDVNENLEEFLPQ